MRLVTPLLLLTLGVAACAGRSPSAADTIAAYHKALATDDPAAAYQLLSPALRKQLSARAFVDRWRTSPEERRRLQEALRPELPPEESAQVRLSDGRTLELVRTLDGWRVKSPRPLPKKHGSPDELLAAIERALAERNAPRLFELLQPELRTLLEDKLQARLAALKARKSGRLEVGADRMRVQLGAFFLELVERDGAWWIADFN